MELLRDNPLEFRTDDVRVRQDRTPEKPLVLPTLNMYTPRRTPRGGIMWSVERFVQGYLLRRRGLRLMVRRVGVV